MHNRSDNSLNGDGLEFVSPSALAKRWACSRSSVDRIARRAGFTRVLLGAGRNGLVRFRLDEVLRFEQERSI